MKMLSCRIEILIFLVALFYAFFCSMQFIMLVTVKINGIVILPIIASFSDFTNNPEDNSLRGINHRISIFFFITNLK